MMVKRIAIVIVALSCFLSGCASDTVQEPVFAIPSPILPSYVDIEAKQKYVQNIKYTLILYRRVILDIKNYHQQFRLEELATEADKYIDMYVSTMLTDSDLGNDVETKVEIAKLYLLVTSIYLEVGYKRQAREYLKSFRNRYENDKHLLDLTLNSMDIGYSTLGEGISELEERVDRVERSSPPVAMYPRERVFKTGGRSFEGGWKSQ